MANDQPFVELPSPPRSPSQTPQDADIRGDNFGPTAADDETVRAQAYRDHIKTISLNHATTILGKLRGNRDAYRTLQHKTLALTRQAPPYLDSP